MRVQLLVLLLAGLLAACSDNGNGGESANDGDAVPASSKQLEPGERPDLEDGQGNRDIEAGKPVTEPTPPDWAAENSAQRADEQLASADQEGSDTQAKKASKSSDPDSQEADSARAPSGIYERYCTACHEKGMAGAPKISNTEEWQKRFDERGMAKLVKHSVKGYRAMPAKGTCMDCTEDELRATIEWMLDEAGVEK